jgi:hypothetical protein
MRTTFHVATFPPREGRGWIASTPEVCDNGGNSLTVDGVDAAHAVAELRYAIGQLTGVNEDALDLRGIAWDDKLACRVERQRVGMGATL